MNLISIGNAGNLLVNCPLQRKCESFTVFGGSIRLEWKKRRESGVKAALMEVGRSGVYFGGSVTKEYQEDFERRFRIPHLTDSFPELSPIPSTFCLKRRYGS